MCWHSLALGDRTASGAGTYADPYGTAAADWNFPAPFVGDPPAFAGTARLQEAAARRGMDVSAYSVSVNAAFGVRAVALSSWSGSANVIATLIAIGRWR